MGQTIISMNLNVNDDEEQYNNFTSKKEQLLTKLSYINRWLSKVNVERNLYDLKTRRERLIERINNMDIKIEKWVDFNVPKREINRRKLPDLV